MTCTFTIKGRLCGLNEMLGEANRHRYIGGQLKKRETQACQWAIIAGNVPSFSTPIRVSVRWIEPNEKRDIDNVAAGIKYILDALVLQKKIPNDTRRWIKEIKHEFPEIDKVNPRIEVTLNDES